MAKAEPPLATRCARREGELTRGGGGGGGLGERDQEGEKQEEGEQGDVGQRAGHRLKALESSKIR